MDVQHNMNPTGRGFRVPLPISKKYFYPLDPRPEDFDIRDVAHKLATQCRYGGGTVEFYSVAEHCVLLSYAVPEEHALAALLHDRAEAYWQDIIRPVKEGYCQPWYGKVERNIECVSAPVFGVPYPNPDVVMLADYRICIDEKQQAYTCPFESENKIEDLAQPLGVKLHFWDWRQSRKAFLDRYNQLSGGQVISW